MSKEYCDFIQCKCNIGEVCITTDPSLCPKNNEQSVYENLDLIKDEVEK